MMLVSSLLVLKAATIPCNEPNVSDFAFASIELLSDACREVNQELSDLGKPHCGELCLVELTEISDPARMEFSFSLITLPGGLGNGLSISLSFFFPTDKGYILKCENPLNNLFTLSSIKSLLHSYYPEYCYT